MTSNTSPMAVDGSLPEPRLPPSVSMTLPSVTRSISWSEIRSRDPSTPWFVVSGNVYDGTTFLKDHPGGADSILLAAGEDATEDFIAIHSMEGRAKLAEVRLSSS